MFTKILLGIMTLGWMVTASGEEQRVWSYYAKEVPKNGSTCNDLGAALAKRMKDLLGLTIFDTQVEDTGDRCQLAVTYNGSWPYPVVSTHFDIQSEDRWPSWGTWSYKTEAECEKDIAPQSITFQQQTGLPPLYAYCPKWRGIDPHSPTYMLKIDGLGTAARTPQLFTAPALMDDVQFTFDNAIRQELARTGATVFHYAPSRDDGSAFHYYAGPGQDPNIKTFTFNGYPNKNDCDSQLPEATRIVQKFNDRILASACSQRPAGGLSTLYVMYVLSGNNSGIPLQREMSEVQYDSVAACVADKAHFESHYAALYGWNVVGSLCRTDEVFETAVTPILFTLD